MRHFTLFIYLLIAAYLPFSVAQTDGWTSTCPSTYPSVSEVMIDACGDTSRSDSEFHSEYIVLRTKAAAFDVRTFALRVTNPNSLAFIGSVAVTNNSLNADALQALNDAAGTSCGYGTVFRNAFSAPYNGIIPPNSTILLFNNKDSTDVSYLSPNALKRLCGSKVFVVFGTLTSQSRGVSIFRNYPQNGSCGSGCFRTIDFTFNGQTCTQFTYDIKKLPHLGTSNPPAGFNEGSFITPKADGSLVYGGGNLTGAGITCMPTTRLECVIPPIPTYGNGFWNILAFDGLNTYNTTDFKGFYEANDHDPTTIPADTINESFTFNTAFDGWQPNSAPSEAIAVYGARSTYEGCNVRSDSFSIQAKRQGFPCGFYKISWKNYDDNARIRLDANGDGVFEYDQSFAAPSCSTGCGGTLWQGDLGAKSRMEIYGSENRGSFNLHLIFQKDTVGHPSVKIAVLGTTPTDCNGAPTGSISTTVTGGMSPYNITWRGATAIAAGTLSVTGLPSGFFHITAIDVLGCVDSAQILVPQTTNITVQAFGDTTFCPNSTAILRGGGSGGNGALTVSWLTSTSETTLATTLNYTPKVSKSTIYVLRATDTNGCFKTDTVAIKTHDVRKIRVTFTPKDTICNDDIAIFTARGSTTYTWTSFPQIGTAALNPQNETATLYALFLPAPVYTFYAAGQDANGCRDTSSAKIWIFPLPVVTITPVMDTLCNDAPPYKLIGTPAIGGRFYSMGCGTCVENGFFYPNRAGAGEHAVQHEFIDANGCKNAPSIAINVKNCRCLTSVVTPLRRSICSGDSIRIKTLFYKTEGIYRDSFINTDGCDSVVILDLSIIKPEIRRVNVKVCPPSVLGTDTLFFKNINGCDSIVLITTKTVARQDSTLFNYNLCKGDSVRVNTIWIKKLGETRLRLTNTEGCDSTLIVTISFKRQDTIPLLATTCNPTKVGFDTLKLRNIVGCDSLIITQTRFIATAPIYRFATTCNPQDSGTQTLRFVNSMGCDSIVILKTTFSKRDTTPLTQQICRSDSFRFGNQWLKTAGIFSRKLTNIGGCDSTIILTLTVQNRDTFRRETTSCDRTKVGMDTLKFQNRFGCDSLIITTTRFANTDTTRLNLSTCAINLVGTITTHFTNRLGCDSIVILNTTLSRRDTTPLNQIICNRDSFRFGTQWLKTAGIYTRILRNTEGCDSTIILTLRIQKTDTTVLLKTSCNPNLIGETTRVLHNSRGCDSIVIIRTNFVPSTIQMALTIAKPITCNGGDDGSIKITTIQNGLSPYQILWNSGSEKQQIDSLKAGMYKVIVTDSSGCSIKDSIQLIEPSAIVLKATGIAPRCYSDIYGAVRLDSVIGGTAPYTLIFQNKRSPIASLPRRLDSIRLGFQVLQIVDGKNCPIQTSVEVPQAPDRSLELGSDQYILLGDSTGLGGFINFTAKNFQWIWTSKDSSLRCATCFPTLVKPIETTNYRLIAQDSAGCEVTDQIIVFVDKPRHVFIPTTFSPNNDIVNDRFMIFGDASVRRVQTFRIYNRWGDPVFDQSNFPINDESAGWDGAAKGVAMPPDVYIYVVIVEFSDGKVVKYKGSVTLIR